MSVGAEVVVDFGEVRVADFLQNIELGVVGAIPSALDLLHSKFLVRILGQLLVRELGRLLRRSPDR